jgi:hypothetical protein
LLGLGGGGGSASVGVSAQATSAAKSGGNTAFGGVNFGNASGSGVSLMTAVLIIGGAALGAIFLFKKK